MLGGSSEIFSQSNHDATISNPLQKNFNWEGKTCWKTKDASVKHGFKTSNLCYMITGKIYILVIGKIFMSHELDVCARNERKTSVSPFMKEVLREYLLS